MPVTPIARMMAVAATMTNRVRSRNRGRVMAGHLNRGGLTVEGITESIIALRRAGWPIGDAVFVGRSGDRRESSRAATNVHADRATQRAAAGHARTWAAWMVRPRPARA